MATFDPRVLARMREMQAMEEYGPYAEPLYIDDMEDGVGPAPVVIPAGASPVPTQAPQFMPPQRPSVRQALPSLIRGALAGATIPNVAEGGAVDVLRAMQAGDEMGLRRDILDYEMARRVENDNALAEQRRAMAEQRRAMADYYRSGGARREPEPPKAEAIGSFGWYDRAGVWHDAPQKQGDQTFVQVTPERGKAIGVMPNEKGEFWVPATAISAVVRGNAPPRPTGERAKVELLKQGYMRQGLPEDEAEEKALADYRDSYHAGTARTKAQTGAANAAAGASGANTGRTVQSTEREGRKEQIRRAADLAISQEATQDPNRARVNVLDPRFYLDWDPQTRAEVAAEIQARIDRNAKGKRSSLVDRYVNGQGAPAGSPGAPQARPDPLGVR